MRRCNLYAFISHALLVSLFAWNEATISAEGMRKVEYFAEYEANSWYDIGRKCTTVRACVWVPVCVLRVFVNQRSQARAERRTVSLTDHNAYHGSRVCTPAPTRNTACVNPWALNTARSLWHRGGQRRLDYYSDMDGCNSNGNDDISCGTGRFYERRTVHRQWKPCDRA